MLCGSFASFIRLQFSLRLEALFLSYFSSRLWLCCCASLSLYLILYFVFNFFLVSCSFFLLHFTLLSNLAFPDMFPVCLMIANFYLFLYLSILSRRSSISLHVIRLVSSEVIFPVITCLCYVFMWSCKSSYFFAVALLCLIALSYLLSLLFFSREVPISYYMLSLSY